MKKFYSNRQFFDFYLGCYYPVMDNIFLHVISCKTFYNDSKSFIQYECEFCVNKNTSFHSIPYFIPVFSFNVNVWNRNIQSLGFEYLIDSIYLQNRFKLFSFSPTWLLPAFNYDLWLSRCRFSLSVYCKEGFL